MSSGTQSVSALTKPLPNEEQILIIYLFNGAVNSTQITAPKSTSLDAP